MRPSFKTATVAAASIAGAFERWAEAEKEEARELALVKEQHPGVRVTNTTPVHYQYRGEVRQQTAYAVGEMQRLLERGNFVEALPDVIAAWQLLYKASFLSSRDDLYPLFVLAHNRMARVAQTKPIVV